MDNEHELEFRIEQAKRYIEMGNHLKKIVRDEEVNSSIDETLDMLKTLVRIYNGRISASKTVKIAERKNQFEQLEHEVHLDYLAAEYADRFGSEKAARMYFSRPLDEGSEAKAYGSFCDGIRFGVLAVVTSLLYSRRSREYRKLSRVCMAERRSYFRLMHSEKREAEMKTTLMQASREVEYVDAEFATELKNHFNAGDNEIQKFLDRPELFCYQRLERIKARHAPGL